MSRNTLKIIALVSMVLDHIGNVLFPEIIVFQVIGRIAFPLFAFFIAEGYYYTKNKGRYARLLFIFAIISWVPYNLAFDYPMYKINVLGVFLISILGMFIIDQIKSSVSYKFMFAMIFVFYILMCLVVDLLALAPEGIVGISLPIVIYATRNKKTLQMFCMGIMLVIMSLIVWSVYGLKQGMIQLLALLSIVLLCMYNGEKGKTNLKYLFYVSYPTHLFVLWLII